MTRRHGTLFRTTYDIGEWLMTESDKHARASRIAPGSSRSLPNNGTTTASSEKSADRRAASGEQTGAHAATARGAAQHETSSGGTTPPAPKSSLDPEVREREKQYMITARRSFGLSPLSQGLAGLFGAPTGPDIGRVYSAVQKMKNVTVVRRIGPSGVSMLAAGLGANEEILVVRAKAEDNRFVAGLAHPGLIVERDYLLGHLGNQGPQVTDFLQRKVMSVKMETTTAQFHVQDSAGAPQEKTQVLVYDNSGGEAQGATDANGNATLSIPGGNLNEIAALYVKPFADCWEKFVFRPSLDATAMNTIVLKRLTEFAPAGFPGEGGFCGWGERLMGLDRIAPEQVTGRGVKVAIIDSGCDNSHPALTHIQIGRDYTQLDAEHMPDTGSWTTDTMSHGTHCAGVIAGNGENGHIRGFVPQAEVHALKLFPGGAFNNLAAALHYCIDNEIDVVNCSLGGDQTSETIQQVIESARRAGVAVVVAAGNSGGPVQFPGSLPTVLCVSAIGHTGEYPDDTYHAQTCVSGTEVAGGLFHAKFSCTGPQVGVCAPGVAVISSVPGGGYASWDGTSMAAPAVTGLLAMVLAHHPEFTTTHSARNSERVDRLFQIVARLAEPVGLPADESGAGLPCVTAAPVQPPSSFARPSTSSAARGLTGEPITQAALEEIVRKAFMSSINIATENRSPL
jgi:subtilisin